MQPESKLSSADTSYYKNLALSSTGVLIKAGGSAGEGGGNAPAKYVHSVILTNTNASLVYVKWYDKATAPTVGTDVPVAVWGLQSNQTFALELNDPMPFYNGIGIGCVTGSADNNTTAPATAIVVDIHYK